MLIKAIVGTTLLVGSLASYLALGSKPAATCCCGEACACAVCNCGDSCCAGGPCECTGCACSAGCCDAK